jgi:hypothetical protein
MAPEFTSISADGILPVCTSDISWENSYNFLKQRANLVARDNHMEILL